MRFSDAKGHRVVSSSTAETVTRVKGFVVDPVSRSVVALRLKKSDEGTVLRWADLGAFGADAVTVTDPTVIGDRDEDAEVTRLFGKEHEVIKKRVLTTGGDELGTVEDVDFDLETGMLTTLLLDKKSSVREVAASRLLGVGSYAVVVRDQV